MKARKSVQHRIGVVLIAIILGYFASLNFFPHTHVVDGRVVAHSHPYLPSAHHSHSSSAIDCIAHMSLLLMLLVIPAALVQVSSKPFCSYSFEERIFNKYFFSRILLRGPPQL